MMKLFAFDGLCAPFQNNTVLRDSARAGLTVGLAPKLRKRRMVPCMRLTGVFLLSTE